MRRVHWYYKFLTIFIVFLSMFFLFNRTISNYISNSSIKGYATYVVKPFYSLKKINVFRYGSLLKENERLKKELLYMKTESDINNSLQDEIKVLKENMSLEKTYTGYNMIYARTITRNKMYWFSTITIDKGSRDGVRTNQAVITKNGLIGVIKDTTKSSSTVKLISNNDSTNRLSGILKVGEESVVGLIEGYQYPYLKISLSSNIKGIKEGDKFYTSGLYDFPKNVYIGTVKKVEKDSYDLSDILYVKPDQDMNDINYVMVLGN